LDADIGDLGECVQAPIARRFANVCSALAPQGACSQAIVAYGSANLAILALEEVLLSMYQNSRVIIFRFNGKTQ